jgi:hypothetical protein
MAYFKCTGNKGVLVDPREVFVDDMTAALFVNAIYDEDACSAPPPNVNRGAKPARLSVSASDRDSSGYLAVLPHEEAAE